MIEYSKNNPHVHITHRLFAYYEYIYSDENGVVHDENGYVFEDWYSPDDVRGWNGIRMRTGGVWETGWSIMQ